MSVVVEILKMKGILTKVSVPEGQSGDWKVEKFIVSEEGAKFHNLRCMMNRERGRMIVAGEYTRLTCNGRVAMSDTPAELNDHRGAVLEAQDHCLIHGLGLGVVLQACLWKPEVTAITVVEISPDVIKLVADHYLKMAKELGKYLEILHGDAYTWQPPKGQKYGMVWHDIWNDICSDNLEGMKKLHRRFGRRARWQGSWCRWLCERGR